MGGLALVVPMTLAVWGSQPAPESRVWPELSLQLALAPSALEGSSGTEPTEAEQVAGLQRMLHYVEAELLQVEQ